MDEFDMQWWSRYTPFKEFYFTMLQQGTSIMSPWGWFLIDLNTFANILSALSFGVEGFILESWTVCAVLAPCRGKIKNMVQYHTVYLNLGLHKAKWRVYFTHVFRCAQWVCRWVTGCTTLINICEWSLCSNWVYLHIVVPTVLCHIWEPSLELSPNIGFNFLFTSACSFDGSTLACHKLPCDVTEIFWITELELWLSGISQT